METVHVSAAASNFAKAAHVAFALYWAACGVLASFSLGSGLHAFVLFSRAAHHARGQRGRRRP